MYVCLLLLLNIRFLTPFSPSYRTRTTNLGLKTRIVSRFPHPGLKGLCKIKIITPHPRLKSKTSYLAYNFFATPPTQHM
jgi:hypothetical protein